MREIWSVIHILKAECQENLKITETCANSNKNTGILMILLYFLQKMGPKRAHFGYKYLKIESIDLQFSARHLQEDGQSFPMVCITSMDNFV